MLGSTPTDASSGGFTRVNRFQNVWQTVELSGKRLREWILVSGLARHKQHAKHAVGLGSQHSNLQGTSKESLRNTPDKKSKGEEGGSSCGAPRRRVCQSCVALLLLPLLMAWNFSRP